MIVISVIPSNIPTYPHYHPIVSRYIPVLFHIVGLYPIRSSSIHAGHPSCRWHLHVFNVAHTYWLYGYISLYIY